MSKRIEKTQSIYPTVLRLIILYICIGFLGGCEGCVYDKKRNKEETGDSPNANAALTMVIAYDSITREVKATVTNAGKKILEANQAKLTWDTGHKDVTIDGNQASVNAINVPGVAVGGNIDVSLGKVAFNAPGTFTTITVTLRWDQMPSDVVETMPLSNNAHVLAALNAKDAVGALVIAVNTHITGGNLVNAEAEYNKIDGEIQKIIKAQTDVGGPGKVQEIDNALTASNQAKTDAKTAYDTAVAANKSDQPTLITDEMITEAKKFDTPFLAEVLQKLKNNEQVDINAGDPYKRSINNWNPPADHATALQRAVELGNLPIIKVLLERGADPNKEDKDQDNPLLKAATKGYVEIVKVLLVQKSTDINKKSNWDQTPLYLAAEHGHLEIVKILLACNGIQIDTQDKEGTTPLKIARISRKPEIEKLLVEAGATE